MIIVVAKKDESVRFVFPNSADIKLYVDCMFVNGEKYYGVGIDSVSIFRVESLPRDFNDSKYYYNGYRFYKKSKMRVKKGIKTNANRKR